MSELKDFIDTPNKLAVHYSDFRVEERILLTGHSHQALPNVALEGMRKAWKDTSDLVDYKWEKVFEISDKVRNGFAKLMNDNSGYYSLAANTHDLIIKFLSALDFKNRPKIITTDMEFHTVRRQLDRLSEENIEVIKVDSSPQETVAERIEGLIDDKTACVIVSKVFFKNGRIIENLGILEKKCILNGSYLLVDVYHVLNVLPFDINQEGLSNSFIVGGGYKYCQLGEGNCFLRFPLNCDLRPVITGWFSEFNKLAEVKKKGEVPYGEGHFRFSGSTFDPVSHYRAAEVFDFLNYHKLEPELLRRINFHQINILASKYDSFDFDKSIICRENPEDLSKSGGFFVLRSAFSKEINEKLYNYDVYTDFREDHLRFGPAPYLSDNQLIEAMDKLALIINEIKG